MKKRDEKPVAERCWPLCRVRTQDPAMAARLRHFETGEEERPDVMTEEQVVATYYRVLSPLLPDEPRQRLVNYAGWQSSSAGDVEAERRRAFLCVDYTVRRFAPAALHAIGLEGEAESLAALPRVTTRAGVKRAVEAVNRAAIAARAAAPSSAVDAALQDIAVVARARLWTRPADVAMETAIAAESTARALGGQWGLVVELFEALLRAK
jgi:hypothetical protein